MRHPSRRLAWPIAAFSLGLLVASFIFDPLLTTGNSQSDLISTDALLFLAFIAFPVLGGMTASRYPENLLSWIFLGVGAALGILALSSGYLAYATPIVGRATAADVTAAWFGNWTWLAIVGVIPIFVPLLFPNGKLLSRGWRWVAWLGGAALSILSLDLMFAERLQGDDYDISNPAGIAAFGNESRFEVLFLLMASMAALSILSFGIRFFRSRGTERQQMKWLLLSLAFLVISMVVLQSMPSPPEWIFPIAVFTIPVSIGVAMLRYRLYDIDVVINRTLVYGTLTAVLGGIYLGFVFGFQALLEPVTAESDLAIAASTLAVAALFRPARARLQGFIDRRFYRRKVDKQKAMEQFNSQLRDEVDLDALSSRLVSVVGSTMQPAHVSLWLRQEADGAGR